MTTYQIKVQEVGIRGKRKHIKNITFDTQDLRMVLIRIEDALCIECLEAEKRFNAYLSNKYKHKSIREIMNTCDIDTSAKGKDVSTIEYYRNELDERVR